MPDFKATYLFFRNFTLKPYLNFYSGSYNSGMGMEIAQTILQQLGGRKFIAMTGAKNLIGSDNSLSFKLGFSANQAKGVTHVRITLLPSDTYKMEFLNVRGTTVKTVKEVSDVYCDQLQEIFTETTGLYTRLF